MSGINIARFAGQLAAPVIGSFRRDAAAAATPRYQPRSQRGREAAQRLAEGAATARTQRLGQDVVRAAANPPRRAEQVSAEPAGAMIGDGGSAGGNNTFADGGVVKAKREIGRAGTLHGKNMKK